MASIEVTTAERQRAERLLDFVKGELAHMTVEARFVFTVEMLRYLKPEIDELKRRAQENT